MGDRGAGAEEQEVKVYAISDGDLIKVGFSGNLRGRLTELQAASPRPLTVCGDRTTERARAVERVAHYLLREQRVRGEWFNVSPEQAISAIDEAVRLVEEEGFVVPVMAAVAIRLTASMHRDLDAIVAARTDSADKAQVTREAIALGLAQMKRRKPQ